MATESTTNDQAEVFKQLDEYPWDKDREFQGGLAAILGPNPNPSQITDLTIRAQCFYLSRKRSIPIDFNAYKEYLLSKPTTEKSIPSPSESSPTTTSMASSSTPPPPPNNTTTLPASHLTYEVPLDDDPRQAPYPKSFAEIVELITSGKPIPGIKEIPNITVPHLASKPMLPKRRKPWEKDVPQEQIDGKIGGLFGDERDIYIPQEPPDDV